MTAVKSLQVGYKAKQLLKENADILKEVAGLISHVADVDAVTENLPTLRGLHTEGIDALNRIRELLGVFTTMDAMKESKELPDNVIPFIAH